MYLPAFFLSFSIAHPLIFRIFIDLKFLSFIPPKAINLDFKFLVSKLNFIVPRYPFLYLLDVLKILDKTIRLHPCFIFSFISDTLCALPII